VLTQLCAATSTQLHLDADTVTPAQTPNPSNPPTPPPPQICDFGLARTVLATHRTTRTCGTISHQPPERLSQGKMAAQGDVYSFGIMSERGWSEGCGWF